MSEPLRIALVAEGPTDKIVIEACISAILGERPFVLIQLQPEHSIAFGPLGAGWSGVYKWCNQSARRGNGRLSNDRLVYLRYDILILHLDADVADKTYSSANITQASSDGPLPCARSCPPPEDTTNALRNILLSWCGEMELPSKTVICMPSKSIESWVIVALFPDDIAVLGNIQCYQGPESRLGQQPIAKRIRKCQKDYNRHSHDLKEAWHRIGLLSEAQRFKNEFEQIIPDS